MTLAFNRYMCEDDCKNDSNDTDHLNFFYVLLVSFKGGPASR